MNTVRQIQKVNEDELALGLTDEQSWHMQHRNNAWIYIGGLPFELTEGDVVCVFSQWGEVEDVHLVRDEATGKSKGFCFIKYEDWRGTILAVDNMNGGQLLGRVVRVDHTDYRPPKEKDEGEAGQAGQPRPKPNNIVPKHEPGHAYAGRELASEHTMEHGHDHFAARDAGASNGRASRFGPTAAGAAVGSTGRDHEGRGAAPQLPLQPAASHQRPTDDNSYGGRSEHGGRDEYRGSSGRDDRDARGDRNGDGRGPARSEDHRSGSGSYGQAAPRNGPDARAGPSGDHRAAGAGGSAAPSGPMGWKGRVEARRPEGQGQGSTASAPLGWKGARGGT